MKTVANCSRRWAKSRSGRHAPTIPKRAGARPRRCDLNTGQEISLIPFANSDLEVGYPIHARMPRRAGRAPLQIAAYQPACALGDEPASKTSATLQLPLTPYRHVFGKKLGPCRFLVWTPSHFGFPAGSQSDQATFHPRHTPLLKRGEAEAHRNCSPDCGNAKARTLGMARADDAAPPLTTVSNGVTGLTESANLA